MLTIVKKNDSYDAITYQLENEDNSTVDLTGASVNFVMGKKNKLITNAKATVTSATSGIVSYQLTQLDTLVSGTFLAEFVVTFANGTVKTYPSNGYITVDVEQNLDTSQANVVVDMIAEKQGDFTSKLNSILQQAGNINMSAMNEYSWTATEGQLIFIFPSSVNYTPSTKWFQVSVGNIPVDNTLVNRSYDNQFALNIDSSNIKAGMTVRAMWVEPVTPVVPTSYKIIPQQNLPPVDAGEGDLWFDTSDNSYQGTVFDDLNTRVTNNATALADRAKLITGIVRATDLGFVGDGATNNVPFLTAIQNNTIVQFPNGTFYFNNTVVTNLTLQNVVLLGSANTIFKFNSDKQFLKFATCKNIIIKNIQFLDSVYTDNVYFQQVAMLAPTTNTNTNITATITGNTVTLTNNGSTAQGVEQMYVHTVNLDSTKEYTIELFDGLFSGNAYDHINIKRYYTDSTTAEDILNLQISTNGHQGQWRWLANYIPIGVTKIDLEFYYMYPFNTSPAPTINIDLSKIKLYQATKPLPDSIDDFCIKFDNSEDILIEGNTFTGIQHTLISNTGVNKNVDYVKNKFINCFNSNIDLSNVRNGYAYKNQIYRNLLTSDGQDVFYTKCSTRGFSVSFSDNIELLNNYVEGCYFGSEAHITTNLHSFGNKFKNTHWGHSWVTNTTGRINNEKFEFRYGWRHCCELAGSVLVDVSDLDIKGDSFQSFCFSLTDNKGGTITIENINVDKTFGFLQFHQDGFTIKKVKINELHAVGILLLPSGAYNPTPTRLRLYDLDWTMSPNFTTVSSGYIFTYLSLSPASSGYIDKVTVKDSVFSGASPRNNMTIYSKKVFFDGVQMKDTTTYRSEIKVDATVIDGLTVIRNSHLTKLTFTADYTATAKVIINNNVLTTCTLPATAIKQNNIIDGTWTA
jgi:hypothetical protein